MFSPWRITARRAIQCAIQSVPSGDLQQIERAIDAAYPFGAREYCPYKIYPSERKEYFKILGIPTRIKKKGEEMSLHFPPQVESKF